MSTSASPAPATGSPRAMAEQDILKIIWPPDGRPAWEDRHKIPRIEQALGTLLDIVEGDDVKPAAIKARESQKLTAHIVASNQLCDICGRPEEIKGGCSEECARENAIKALQGEPIQPAGITATDLPEALRSAASDQLVEANKMIADMDSAEARPPNSAADHIVEANEMVVQAPPKVEQVSGQAALQEARPEQNENPTIRKDRMVEESKEVRPGGASPEKSEKPENAHPKTAKVPLTDSQKAQILDLHAKGVNNHDIAAQLGIKDTRQVQGCIIARRKTAENVPAAKKDDTSTEPAKDVMLLQQPANVADTSDTSPAAPKPTEDKPAPKAMTRAETDKKMWDLWKSGKSPKEIADILWDEDLYYSEKSVTVRLRSQGADL